MTEQGESIIDYAAPAKQSGMVRLPAQSVIEIDVTEGAARVEQKLIGKVTATLALIFAAFVMAIMLTSVISAITWGHSAAIETAQIQLPLLSIMALLSIAVINNTWRRTLLTATPDSLELLQRGPFARGKPRRWSASEVLEIHVRQVSDDDGRPLWTELDITTAGTRMQLFSGQPPAKLVLIADAVKRILKLQRHPQHTPAPMRAILVAEEDAPLAALPPSAVPSAAVRLPEPPSSSPPSASPPSTVT